MGLINNRQNGRRRGRGGSGGGSGPRQGGNPGRPDSGNRIDSRARGNASQLHEKYKTLAADAQRQGDRVTTEYYLQFADHYFRVLSEQRGRFEEQQQRRPQQDAFDGDEDADEEFGDEGEAIRAGEQAGGAPRQQAPRSDDLRHVGQRDDDGRAAGQRREAARRDGPRDEERRDDRQRTAGERFERAEQQPRAAATAQPANDLNDGVPPVETASEPVPAPKRRGRPRRDTAVAAPADESFDADRLPPALSTSSDADAGDAVEKKPVRRRGRPPATEATAAG